MQAKGDLDEAALAVLREPQGQKHLADVTGCAVTVARIAARDAEDSHCDQSNKVKASHAGAGVRPASLTSDERSVAARKAVAAKWR